MGMDTPAMAACSFVLGFIAATAFFEFVIFPMEADHQRTRALIAASQKANADTEKCQAQWKTNPNAKCDLELYHAERAIDFMNHPEGIKQ